MNDDSDTAPTCVCWPKPTTGHPHSNQCAVFWWERYHEVLRTAQQYRQELARLREHELLGGQR